MQAQIRTSDSFIRDFNLVLDSFLSPTNFGCGRNRIQILSYQWRSDFGFGFNCKTPKGHEKVERSSLHVGHYIRLATFPVSSQGTCRSRRSWQ